MSVKFVRKEMIEYFFLLYNYKIYSDMVIL